RGSKSPGRRIDGASTPRAAGDQRDGTCPVHAIGAALRSRLRRAHGWLRTARQLSRPCEDADAMNRRAAEHPLVEPLLRWYADSARDLPWRRTDTTPWGVLVSEVMLQQTPVSRVLPAYAAWLRRWPTPAALAADPPGEAVRMWAKLGYPRRALR